MNTTISHKANKSNPERGAALITTLLISALLLTAGGTLILTTSMSAVGTVDAAGEMQAYYGAEAGLQATLNVLRGNVLPNPLFVANPPGGVASENRIDFTKALTLATSNLAGDPTSAGFPPRLSRWITYNFRPTGAAYDDRVAISAGYNPFNGVAYNIELTDPDNTPLATDIPLRLVVKSTGLGPRGAKKTLSMMVTANALDIEVPAALVLRGHDDATTDVNIDLGISASKTYSGVDNAGLAATKASLAISAHDIDVVEASYSAKPKAVASPKYQILKLPNDPPPYGTPPDQMVDTPWFLQTANDARKFLADAELLANSCAAPGTPCVKRGVIVPSLNGTAGSDAAPQFTIVKGDCHLDSGAGLLIVEGTMYFNGAGPNFNGLILILGQGRLLKQGGGNRDVYGSIMVARFGATGGFLEPTFEYLGGGGSANLQYDSRADKNSVVLTGPSVLGIAEKSPTLP
jgi:hypothetical protein